MKILVLNSWSSSLKYELFDMPQQISLASGLVERIGIEWWKISYEANWNKIKTNKEFSWHKDALKEALNFLTTWESAIISDLKNIDAVWHRVVHGWENFSASVVITDDILKEIHQCSDLAPLHNPANIQWVEACQEIMWNTPQIWVFDTAFHQTMEKENYLYAIPYEYYTKHKIRKYWFHGTSHKYVSHRACEILNTDINTQKIITCHIWNWASIAAIKGWEVVNTSMWFTPLAGLVMWTRSGDIDPAIIWFLNKKEGLSNQEIDNILNKKSWLLWLSEQSSDLRDIETGDAQCQLAFNVYINRIIEYIGSYIALMWWVDTIVFTAWAWEKSPIVRQRVVDKLSYLGINLDTDNNNIKSEEILISTTDSKVNVIVVPTKEELMIATDTYNLVNAIS